MVDVPAGCLWILLGTLTQRTSPHLAHLPSEQMQVRMRSKRPFWKLLQDSPEPHPRVGEGHWLRASQLLVPSPSRPALSLGYFLQEASLSGFINPVLQRPQGIDTLLWSEPQPLRS